jgi:hypothetical protein
LEDARVELRFTSQRKRNAESQRTRRKKVSGEGLERFLYFGTVLRGGRDR